MAAKAAAPPAKAGAENSWTPFVKLLMGIGKDNKHDAAKSGVQSAGIFGSNGSTYYVDPKFEGLKCGVDEDEEKKTKKDVKIDHFPKADEIKTLWAGLQSALKNDRDNDFIKTGIRIGGTKFMFSKVLEVQGKDAKEGVHKCVIGRCKNTACILTPNAKSFTIILSAPNYNAGNITTHCFVAHSLKKSGQ